MIVRYGSNDRSRVPIYRRSGFGRVLGGQGRLRLFHDGSTQLFSLGDRSGEGTSAFRDRALLSKASQKKARVFRLRPESDQKQPELCEDEADFVPLSGSRGKDTKKDAYVLSKDEKHGYRSILGKAKPRDFVDSDLESADTSDSEAGPELDSSDPTRQRSIELFRTVKDHPDDTRAWLELVDLQEDLLRLDQDARQGKTNDEAKALANMRVSLLEEALPHASKNTDKERLFLRLMREGSRVWNSKALAKRWAEASPEGGSLALWTARLDHDLSSMATFSYAGLRKMHTDRLLFLTQRLSQTLRSALDSGEGKSLEEICNTHDNTLHDLIHTSEELIYVFLRTTSFVREAGYSELAVASWQAMLELTFAYPTQGVGSSPAELTASFQDFWESEIPRIGEEGAKGWRHFVESPEEMAELPGAKTDSTPDLPDTRDAYKAWAAAETQSSHNAILPARTLDEGTEDDPFRVVMFADLEPLLIHLPRAMAGLPQVRASVLNAFLLFCRLPPAFEETGNSKRDITNDPFIYRNSPSVEQIGPGQRDTAEDGTKQRPRFRDSGHRFVESADVIFSSSDWFRFFNHEPSPLSDLALTATTQLATSFNYEPIAVYSMGLTYTKNPTAIRKPAKALLKNWPNNALLYEAYAFAEWHNGKQDTARNVLLSATSQSIFQRERLWTTWAWLDLDAGSMQAALAHCISASRDDQPSGAESTATYSQLLRARQALSSSREFLLSSGKIQQAALSAETATLLEYVAPFASSTESSPTRQGNIQAAMDSVHRFASDAVARKHGSSAHLERYLQFAAHLLYLHATRGPFQPNYLREQLEKFVTMFPTNTMFLGLFAWADTSIILNDPVRALLRNHVLTKTHDCLTGRLFAIQHEIHVGSVHSVRTAFERALDSDVCRGNVGLWLSYVRFCERNKRELRSSVTAKDVYYRAIGACPWAKELAMDAFTTLIRDMESSELRAVWNMTITKGLRVCVDLEEFSNRHSDL